jgi:hypothetical protein
MPGRTDNPRRCVPCCNEPIRLTVRKRFCKRRHQTASGRGFALADVARGVRGGRSRNFGQNDREAEWVYLLALMLKAIGPHR